jgi:hypothetical protein
MLNKVGTLALPPISRFCRYYANPEFCANKKLKVYISITPYRYALSTIVSW